MDVYVCVTYLQMQICPSIANKYFGVESGYKEVKRLVRVWKSTTEIVWSRNLKRKLKAGGKSLS